MRAMFDLYDKYYAATSRSLFEADLRNKDFVVTLREPSGGPTSLFAALQIVVLSPGRWR